ncbi:hypothetical protein CERSUDRAFT_122688 [Gelatoporia subvermispora B]|uniref:Heterokaryon incompatibility domain-containing protein n=1 Tax=Ceriporiopsis subvermispora (strain B) TaxID=914234 RepID=M2RKA3_CERS8|nr:hypothetical protein CERSUDRAFT_122688 [Gelatoporia subvermispora B]
MESARELRTRDFHPPTKPDLSDAGVEEHLRDCVQQLDVLMPAIDHIRINSEVRSTIYRLQSQATVSIESIGRSGKGPYWSDTPTKRDILFRLYTLIVLLAAQLHLPPGTSLRGLQPRRDVTDFTLGRNLLDILMWRWDPLEHDLVPRRLHRSIKLYDIISPPSLSLIVPTISSEAIWLGVTYDFDESIVSSATSAGVPTISPDAVWLGAKHEGYEISDMEDYIPTRLPHIQSDVDFHTFVKSFPAEYAALEQSRLTFGLIEAVLERPIPEILLLKRTIDDAIFMTTANIPLILQDFRDRILAAYQLSPGTASLWADRILETFGGVRRVIEGNIVWRQSSPFHRAKLSQDHIDHIQILCAAIAEALSIKCGLFKELWPKKLWTWTTMFGTNRIVDRKMIAQGWCPFTVSRLANSSICGLVYASTREPFFRHDAVHKGHPNCTMYTCTLDSINVNEYSTKHCSADCRCEYTKPSLENVLDILSRNQIPVIKIRHSTISGTGLDLEVCPSSPNIPYVAISHVWADGMGSITDQGLPTCQLQRLATLVHQLSPDAAIWMDSLCVPRDTARRRKAIGLMAQTYREASIVLVVDSGIRSCSANAPREEMLMRVFSSGWMQRLWTLQEALLARELVFEFSDDLQDIRDLTFKLDAPPVQLAFGSELLNLMKEVFDMASASIGHKGFGSFGLSQVAWSLRWRTTSREADETLAIAGLLNVDAYRLAALSSDCEIRMKHFLLELQILPSDIIFMIPKMRQTNFHWAPKTFTDRYAFLMRNADDPGHGGHPVLLGALCTPEGLITTYPYVRFTKTTFTSTTSFENDKFFFLRNGPFGRNFAMTIHPDPRDRATITEYTFNAILYRYFPDAGSDLRILTNAAAVFVHWDHPVETDQQGRTRWKCEYIVELGMSALLFDYQEGPGERWINAEGGTGGLINGSAFTILRLSGGQYRCAG